MIQTDTQPPARDGRSIVVWLRQESLIIVLYALVLTLMTYPLMFRLSEIIPLHNPDTYTAMWQNWWLQQALTNGLDTNTTSYLFYPHGLDLTLMPRRWTSYPLWALYHALWGEPIAYNLTVLTQTLIKAYAMYRLILLFVPHRASAWIGGAFFAFAPRILAAGIQQPNTGALEFIPIFMICFVLALRHIQQTPHDQRRMIVLMVLSGLTFSANVYMNIKIGVFAMFIGGCYGLWVMVIHRLWQQRNFWLGMVLFGLVSCVISAPILIPTLTYNDLNDAINQFVPNRGLNALSYLKADLDHPLFYNNLRASVDGVLLNQRLPQAFGHIGFVSLLLTLVGSLIIIRKRRDQLIWLVIGVLFFWLSLGAVIVIGDTTLESFPTLYPLLLDNPLFVALREPFRFQVMVIFAMAIVMAYGVQAIFRMLSTWQAYGLYMIVVALMLLELSIFPMPYRLSAVSPAYEYVTQQSDQALIVMPMGRQNAKYAMYNQLFHQRPLPEGTIARMPESAYDYIESNLLLRDMSDINSLQRASDDLLNNWNPSIDALLDDGFRYVVVHRLVDTGTWKVVTHTYQERMFFMEIDPDFETESVAVYDLQKLRDHPPQGDPFAED